jgi:hypothetical protein
MSAWALAAILIAALPQMGKPPPEKGISLGLFSADETWDYGPLIDEIHDAGATHLSITWVVWQDDVAATEIKAVRGLTATDEQVVATIKKAKALGMHVTAFPILRLLRTAKGEWRGKIAPADEDVWWENYRTFMLHAAALAHEAEADRLAIGSELVSRELMRDRWIDLIERVRAEHANLELMYSANWDHYREVSFWDAVDVIGLTAYWELTRDYDASVDDLVLSWTGVRKILEGWSRQIERPLVLAEIGYPSLDGAAAWPWDETRKSRVDLEEQRRAYEAFARSWSNTSFLQGVYWWNWFGFGGSDDGNYTPRGKPAQDVIRRWYGRAPAAPVPIRAFAEYE